MDASAFSTHRETILIGLGSNLGCPGIGPPLAVLREALLTLELSGIRLINRSRWYRSAPVPPSPQPDYVNGVVMVATEWSPHRLLDSLLAIERTFGRVRSVANAARTLDLDLLAYGNETIVSERLTLPHPRLHERAFVLRPLADVAAHWKHPHLNRSVSELIDALPVEATVDIVDEGLTRARDRADADGAAPSREDGLATGRAPE